MLINMPEILVANCSGLAMIIILFYIRIHSGLSKQEGEQIYDWILIVAIASFIAETASFIIDGRLFTGCFTLSYLTNSLCTGGTVFVGFLWCLYSDFRIYRSKRRLKRKFFVLGALFLAVAILLIINTSGNGLIFQITEDNRYIRGEFNIVIYIVLFLYYTISIATAYRSRRNRIYVELFPVYLFVIPCIAGTIIQGLCYGIAVGWLSVAVAAVFIHIQLQNFNSFVDETSGLFNRKYLNYYLKKMQKAKTTDIYGIMVDVNNFKSINDTCGHSVGDQAIKEIGRIFTGIITERITAIRMAGDEFIIIIENTTEAEAIRLKQSIKDNADNFNKTTDMPFRLSFAMGIAEYKNGNAEEFLSELDRKMYNDKDAYYMAYDTFFDDKGDYQ